MRDDNGELQVPEFKSEIPEHLVESLSPKEKWQYEQISIQGKRSEWLIERHVKADRRQNATDQKMEDLDARVRVFEDLRKILTTNWAIAAGILTVFIIPLALAYLGALFSHWFEKLK